MPQYSVEDVLDIIKTLTDDEKAILQDQIVTVLKVKAEASDRLEPKTKQSQSFGNITIGSGGSSSINQIAADGGVSLDRSTMQFQGGQPNLQETIKLLQTLKQEIDNYKGFDKIEKRNLASTIEVVEEEIKQPKPDKDLVDRAIEGIRKN